MPARILIVEDDPVQRMDLRHVLIEEGYQVVGETADGETAVDLARSLQPDLVIMDLILRAQNSLNAAALLRQEDIAPVIVLSAFNDAHFVTSAIHAGVHNYLIKPLLASEVKPAVEMALASYAKQRELAARADLITQELAQRKRAEREKGFELERKNIIKWKTNWEL
jgi:response regulator NasT